MHKKSVTVSIAFVSEDIDKEQAISDAVHGINGVPRWRIEEIRDNEYTIQIWLANGLDHVNAENAVSNVLDTSEKIESFTLSS